MKRSLFVSMFFVYLLVSAGLSVLRAQEEYVNEPMAMPEKRNTLATNLTPLVVASLNALPFQSRWNLVYKRQVKPWQKHRVYANFESIENTRLVRDDSPLDWSDTTITFVAQSSFFYNVDLRFGTEFFKPNRLFTMVYGFDAFGGFARRESEQLTTPYYFDAETGWGPSPFVGERIDRREITYAFVGLDFSIAQRIQVKDHVYFTIQWTPELSYRWPVSEVYSTPQARTSAPNASLDFRLRGLEVYFNYSL